MKSLYRIGSIMAVAVMLLVATSCKESNNGSKASEIVSLKEAFDGKFLIGAALNTPQSLGEDTSSLEVVNKHFNSIVAENCMKGEILQPEQGVYDFTIADQFVEYGEANNMFIIGHTLVWHSQAPPWIFIDKEGNDVSRDTLIARMKDHIFTVVGRYKGRVHGWDVVNEAVTDDAGLRESKWFNIIGADFIKLAFQFAHEADSEAELYYNDYNLYKPHKRNETIKMVQSLLDEGCRVDGIGMQAHYSISMDIYNEVEESILAFSEVGVDVMITELDISVLPFPTEKITAEVSQNYEISTELNPYPEVLPDSVQSQLSDYYTGLFKIYTKHADKISRVTFWGVNDAQTWRNYWPIYGRTDYPLFFDRENNPKPVFYEVTEMLTSAE